MKKANYIQSMAVCMLPITVYANSLGIITPDSDGIEFAGGLIRPTVKIDQSI